MAQHHAMLHTRDPQRKTMATGIMMEIIIIKASCKSNGSNGVRVDVIMVVMVDVANNAVGEAEKLSVVAAEKRNRRIRLSCISTCLHVYNTCSYIVT